MIFFLNCFVAFYSATSVFPRHCKKEMVFEIRKGSDSGLILGVGGCCNAPVSKPEACTAA
jgi:hypothetical protein